MPRREGVAPHREGVGASLLFRDDADFPFVFRTLWRKWLSIDFIWAGARRPRVCRRDLFRLARRKEYVMR
jgi:hypothetical protein